MLKYVLNDKTKQKLKYDKDKVWLPIEISEPNYVTKQIINRFNRGLILLIYYKLAHNGNNFSNWLIG